MVARVLVGFFVDTYSVWVFSLPILVCYSFRSDPFLQIIGPCGTTLRTRFVDVSVHTHQLGWSRVKESRVREGFHDGS